MHVTYREQKETQEQYGDQQCDSSLCHDNKKQYKAALW